MRLKSTTPVADGVVLEAIPVAVALSGPDAFAPVVPPTGALVAALLGGRVAPAPAAGVCAEGVVGALAWQVGLAERVREIPGRPAKALLLTPPLPCMIMPTDKNEYFIKCC